MNMLARLFRNKDTYYVFIATNIAKTELATGITTRIKPVADPGPFPENPYPAGNSSPCIYWIHYERFTDATSARQCKRQWDKLSLEHKVDYISEVNAGWEFLNLARP